MAIIYGSGVTIPSKKRRGFKRILNSIYPRSSDSVVTIDVNVKYPKRVK